MDECDQTQFLEAYYDGELSPADSRALEAHLRNCAPCARELETLRSISRTLQAISLPRLEAAAFDRIASAAPLSEERSLLTLVRRFTAVAAAILLVACLRLSYLSARDSGGEGSAAWQVQAVIPVSDAPPAGRGDAQFAQWVVDDLSTRGPR